MDVTKYLRPETLTKEHLKAPRSFIIADAEEVNFSRSATAPEYQVMVILEDESSGERFSRSLNDTNLRTLVRAFGKQTDDWLEQETIWFVDPNVEMEGEKIGGIRVQLPEKKKLRPKRGEEIAF